MTRLYKIIAFLFFTTTFIVGTSSTSLAERQTRNFGICLSSACNDMTIFSGEHDYNSNPYFGDLLGETLASGDFNGDGYEDLVMGASEYNGGNSRQKGRIYIVFGPFSNNSTGNLNDTIVHLSGFSADVTFTGNFSNYSSTSSIAINSSRNIGDIDNDGDDELVFSNGKGSYLIFGSPTLTGSFSIPNDIVNGNLEAVWFSSSSSEAWNKSAGCDINNDGYSDLLIGAQSYDGSNGSNQGAVVLIPGSASFASDHRYQTYDVPTQVGSGLTVEAKWFMGAQQKDQVGYVACAGDIDNDQYQDILIGSKAENEIYLVYGDSFSNPSYDLGNIGTSFDGAIFETDYNSSYFGSVFTGIGDFNGDNIDDFAIGDEEKTVGSSDYKGIGFIYYGQSSRYNGSYMASNNPYNNTAPLIFYGEGYKNFAGQSLSSADINADGISDFIVGARGNKVNGNSFAGAGYVIYGGQSLSTIQLSDVGTSSIRGYKLSGFYKNTYLGKIVVGARDLTGDGIDDAIFSAHYADNGAGNVVVVQGEALVTPSTLINASSHTTDQYLIGSQGGDWFGSDLTFVTDITGDGADELLVGAPYYDSGTVSNSGAAFFFADPLNQNLSNAQDADIIFEGTETGSQTGYQVTDIGDYDGDGLHDIAISARKQSGPTSQRSAGRVYVVFGSSLNILLNTSPVIFDLDDIDASSCPYGTGACEGFILNGQNKSDFLGETLSALDDVNNDGFDDFAVSAPFRREARFQDGVVYIFYGGQGLNSSHNPNTTADAVFYGLGARTNFGKTLSRAGDVNADGFDDFLVGATVNHSDGTQTGEFYLIYGATSFSSGVISNISYTLFSDATVTSEFGLSAASLGDWNQDGYDDFILGSAYADGNATESGEAYLFYGNTSLSDNSFNSANIVISGEDAFSHIGFDLGLAGDTNQDGAEDLFISGHHAQGLVHYGFLIQNGALSSSQNIGDLLNVIEFGHENINAAQPFTIVNSHPGDLNGDGYNDLGISSNTTLWGNYKGSFVIWTDDSNF